MFSDQVFGSIPDEAWMLRGVTVPCTRMTTPVFTLDGRSI
jgi:hypothetical protein